MNASNVSQVSRQKGPTVETPLPQVALVDHVIIPVHFAQPKFFPSDLLKSGMRQ